jgi:hypothetical protein
VINPHACLNPDCSAFESPGHWQRDSDYSEYVAQLITGPGVYVPDVTELRDHWFGDYPLGESYRDTVNRDGINAPFADSISVVATPEPNTGFLVGACFLLCAAIAFRRKILAVCEPSQELLKWDSSQARSAAS